jgi:hypothetical protein
MKENAVAFRNGLPAQAHPLFRGVFDHWQAKAGALSALPHAPVVPDDVRQHGPGRRWLQSRCAQSIDWP